MYIQVAFCSSATCDLVWLLGRGLSGETLVSPDKTGNDMCLSGETSVSPDKAIMKGKPGMAGGGVFEAREEFCYFTNRFQSNVPQNSVE